MSAVGFEERGLAVRWAVRRLVRSGGVTVTGLAMRCRISQGHMANWLGGRRGLSAARLDQVVESLGLDLAAVEADWMSDEPVSRLPSCTLE